MRIVVWLLPGFFLVSSCGNGDSQRVETKKLHNPPTFSITGDFAAEYVIEDPDCQSSSGVTELSGGKIYSFQDAQPVSTSVKFDAVSSGTSLESDLIFNSKYGFHQVSQCEIVNGEVECEGDTKVVQGSTDLKICNPDNDFARNSVEGVGLSGLYSLEQAYQFYDELPSKKSMRQARLLILPKIEKKIRSADGSGERSQFLTDNLAYAPSYLNEPAFVIFPKSKTAVERGLWTNVNLWEVPWAMAHEFGHHVFRTHTGRSSLSGLGETLPLHSYDNSVSDSPGEVPGFGLLANGPKEIWGAFNEGFADLYATYTFGEGRNLVDGFDCFERNRDIFTSSFANGRSKRFDNEVNRIFRSSSKVTVGNCETPNFQDIHIIGAVVAYGVNAVLEAGNFSTAEKADALLDWADAIGRRVSQSTDNAEFAPMIEAVLQAAGKGDDLSSRQCDLVESIFPAITSQLDLPGCTF